GPPAAAPAPEARVPPPAGDEVAVTPAQLIPPLVLTPDKALQEIEQRNVELNRRLNELGRKYEELRLEVKKHERVITERTLQEKKTTAFAGGFGQTAART